MVEDGNYGLPDLEPVVLGWLAGLLEGEGCFAVARHPGTVTGPYMSPTITVAMTDRDVIERAAKLLGTKVNSRKPFKEGNKAVFEARLAGVLAVRWMLRLQPLLGERRGLKVQAILAEWKNYASRRVLNASTGVLRYTEKDREFVLSLLGIRKSVDELLAEREEKNKKKDAERGRAWREENPEKWREVWRSYQLRNPETLRQRRRDYYWRNLEKQRASARKSRLKRRDASIAYGRGYHAKNRERLNEKSREYRKSQKSMREQELNNG